MPVKPPTIDELWRIAEDYYLNPSQADLESFSGLIAPMLKSYDRLDQFDHSSAPGFISIYGLPVSTQNRAQPEAQGEG